MTTNNKIDVNEEYDKSTEGGYQELTTASGKYLCFSLNTEMYGFELCSVQEIIRDLAITRVPNSPHYLTGVANLRGKVTPIVDLAIKLNSVQRTEQSPWIVVLEVHRDGKFFQVGIIVDGLPEVVNLPDVKLQRRSDSSGGAEFVVALGRTDEHVILILDVEKLVSDSIGVAGDF
ncbi:MAG: chemotaxis protein CheW [Pseudomonadales bacterium]|nr:chemotaxis protein CheW [Pseudomonadales bacterium]